MRPSQINLIACPVCQSKLTLKVHEVTGDRIKSGTLVDDSGHSFPIVDFIPRFVPHQNYASNFSVQWEDWPELLSQYDGYRTRFENETKWGTDLSGKTILEAGCGSGAFTEFAAATGAEILSFDLSKGGVEANYSRNKDLSNVLIVQADVYHIPALPGSFDYAFCFGVLQHTPKPKDSFMALCESVKERTGKVAADIYTMPPVGHPYEPLWRNKYRMRKLVSSLPKIWIRRFVEAYVNMAWPIRTLNIKLFKDKGILYNRALLLDDYPPRLPGMDPRMYKSFAKLDIFDFLGPDYDFPVSEDEYKSWFLEAGLFDIDVHPGYNGLEGRGKRGPTPT